MSIRFTTRYLIQTLF